MLYRCNHNDCKLHYSLIQFKRTTVARYSLIASLSPKHIKRRFFFFPLKYLIKGLGCPLSSRHVEMSGEKGNFINESKLGREEGFLFYLASKQHTLTIFIFCVVIL